MVHLRLAFVRLGRRGLGRRADRLDRDRCRGVLLHAFALFTLHRGTPAPVAPTETLVVTGVYRFVRNPIYLAVLTIILGQALLFGSWWLVLYAVIALATVVAFVKGYKEPTLTRTYGKQYLDYRRNVPGWWPRLTPWRV